MPATVVINHGSVKGTTAGGVTQFLGIPYAAPPVGARRWEPPQQPTTWTKVRTADHYAPNCPQKDSSGVFARPSMTEDCLYLNVFVPPRSSSPKPVMVWIHGGGLFSGESDDYDAHKLVKDGKLVVVTFNYRIGRLGYFPRKSKDGSAVIANYGLLDQLFALQWVRDNIGAFGGDPNRVTIAGESAGAESVYALMVSPAAKGLFHRAIAQSGGYTPHMPSIADTAGVGTKFSQEAGCPDQSMRCLRALSVSQILAAQDDMTVALVVDGITIPSSFDAAFADGAFYKVPVLSGINRDEARWFFALGGFPKGLPRTQVDYVANLDALYGAARPAVQAQYPLAKFGSPVAALSAAETDLRFACPQDAFDTRIARWTPLFSYEFDEVTAPSYLPPAGFELGAAHTFELQYLFPRFRGATGMPRILNHAQARLSDRMVGYWSRFASSGDPNLARKEQPEWPRYRQHQEKLILQLETTSVVEDSLSRHNCAFWDRIKLPAE
ncbi:MAG TPA: carboxylesterase family protein [Sphingobium sp.]